MTKPDEDTFQSIGSIVKRAAWRLRALHEEFQRTGAEIAAEDVKLNGPPASQQLAATTKARARSGKLSPVSERPVGNGTTARTLELQPDAVRSVPDPIAAHGAVDAKPRSTPVPSGFENEGAATPKGEGLDVAAGRPAHGELPVGEIHEVAREASARASAGPAKIVPTLGVGPAIFSFASAWGARRMAVDCSPAQDRHPIHYALALA